MQVCLIRHGSTPGNLEGRYVGSTDEALTEAAMQELKKNRTRYPLPDIVFTSPLRRCCQTAELLFPEETPEVLSGLRECGFGAFEYKNYQELSGDARYQEWIDSKGTLPFPGGESREEFAGRCCAAFLQGCREAEQRGCTTVAFVVHGGTIMAVLERFGYPKRDYFDYQVGNACGFYGWMDDAAGAPQIRDFLTLPYETGVEDQYVLKNHQKLRCGYTTGSCAAAAAKAAVSLLLGAGSIQTVSLDTPKGTSLRIPVQIQRTGPDSVTCAVRKYAGDDPDATDGILILADAKRIEKGIVLEGGAGVGRVTKPGLEQPVGAAAINRVPRKMIRHAVEEVCAQQNYRGGIQITISVPRGEEIAKRTFNPHLGIMGGISILGTKGIVMPMSEEALIASIRLEMKQKKENGEQYLLITPGNYGADFIRRKERSAVLDAGNSMKCSNFVGETLDMAVELGVKGILFVAHIGKFIKVSGGIMNTHSAWADCRAELMAAQTARALQKRRDQAAPQWEWENKLIQRILATNTTEEAVGMLHEEGLLADVMEETLQRISHHLQKRCRGALETEVILFSNQYGYLAETPGADAMIERISLKQTI